MNFKITGAAKASMVNFGKHWSGMKHFTCSDLEWNIHCRWCLCVFPSHILTLQAGQGFSDRNILLVYFNISQLYNYWIDHQIITTFQTHRRLSIISALWPILPRNKLALFFSNLNSCYTHILIILAELALTNIWMILFYLALALFRKSLAISQTVEVKDCVSWSLCLEGNLPHKCHWGSTTQSQCPVCFSRKIGGGAAAEGRVCMALWEEWMSSL